jgi:hypothetical protein
MAPLAVSCETQWLADRLDLFFQHSSCAFFPCSKKKATPLMIWKEHSKKDKAAVVKTGSRVAGTHLCFHTYPSCATTYTDPQPVDTQTDEAWEQAPSVPAGSGFDLPGGQLQDAMSRLPSDMDDAWLFPNRQLDAQITSK